MKDMILGATIGNCVHVAGIQAFLRMAEAEGYNVRFLGMRVSPSRLAGEILRQKPALVAISYRLTPEAGSRLFEELKAMLPPEVRRGTRFVFGGTPPVAEAAICSGLFERVFSGGEAGEQVRAYLRGSPQEGCTAIPSQSLTARVAASYPYPLVRHHFGRPTLEETVEGARRIAEARVLDVLSLGPDQNAQEHFFHPEDMDPTQDGAGGVPVRRPEDLEAIYQASRCGNYPLVRCYSGTRDLQKWAEMSLSTIQTAWAAIPLCWYSQLDGRSSRPLEVALGENLQTIRWYAERQVPVEVNESHQWSLRSAHDVLAVAMAFLAAYNAKRRRVRTYVSQYMFNTPPGTTPRMDLAKMQAKQELIGSLEDDKFTVLREVRAGLASLSPRPNVAKGQMASSAVVSLAMKPHILHVVGFSEGDHAVTAAELIESCEIAHGVLKGVLHGLPDLAHDDVVQKRKAELVVEAQLLLQAIGDLAPSSPDPWATPAVLVEAVAKGILDAPGLYGNPHARGDVVTAIIGGACRVVDPKTGEVLSEADRLGRLGDVASLRSNRTALSMGQ